MAISYGNSIYNFLKNLYTVFYSGCTKLHSHQQWRRVPFFLQYLHYLLSVDFMMTVILTSVRYLIMIFFTYLIINHVEHLFMRLLVIHVSSLQKSLFRSSAHCLIGLSVLFIFFTWSCISCLHILEINPLLVIEIYSIYSHSLYWIYWKIFENIFSLTIGLFVFLICWWLPLLCKSF